MPLSNQPYDSSKENVAMSEEFLTIDELAARLKVPRSWIYSRTRLLGPDAIPRMKVGKYLRFSLQEVLEWLRQQQILRPYSPR
jgi:excisionase family DNA binding protein